MVFSSIKHVSVTLNAAETSIIRTFLRVPLVSVLTGVLLQVSFALLLLSKASALRSLSWLHRNSSIPLNLLEKRLLDYF